MSKAETTYINPFETAVDKSAELKGSWCPGLTAMGGNSIHVHVGDTRQLNGSVDIDQAVKISRPNEARWDYAIGYGSEAYFIEVHPADTKNVDEMVKKVSWLKQWLKSAAPELKKLHRCGMYHWIPSGRVKILKTSPQYKKIALHNLSIVKTLNLK